jgi:uncharacterized protein with ParB-like and HNH nuclease domain
MNNGINPFVEDRNCIRSVNFTLDSILHKLDLSPEYIKRDKPYEINGINVGECNFNPFVMIDGIKKYYQRPLVWSLEDKQNLIESIYCGIGCGSIVIKINDWTTLQNKADDGETELFFNDVVDGKQRLNTIHEFVNNKFCDRNGNYYEQFSKRAQYQFLDHQLFAYGEIDSRVKDEDVLKQFLKVNFAGVPQSLEHIEYVKGLL